MTLKKKDDTAATSNATTANEVVQDAPQETAQETAQEQASPEAETKSEVIPANPQGSALTVNTGGNLQDALEDEGFEGLEFGFHSFTSIRLDKGAFSTSEDEDLGTSIICNILSSKAKFAYTAKFQDEDLDTVEFSYDKVTTTKGEAIADIVAEWKAEGATVEMKTYSDVQADVLEGDLEGEMVLMSVSPSSVQRLSGYLGKLKRKGYPIKETRTECFVSPKIGSGKKAFTPWGFRLAS